MSDGLVLRKANIADDDSGEATLLGFLDLVSSIDNLKTDWYQRRAGFSEAKIRKLVRDMLLGDQMPAIILGMRGDKFDVANDGAITLRNPVYLIDGLQRWMAALLAREKGYTARLAAQVYLNTSEQSEIVKFRKLNSTRTGLAPSIHIRNEKQTSRVAATLVGLSGNEPNFALVDRIAWDQRFDHEQHLVAGITLLHVLVQLHFHLMRITPGGRALELLALTDARIDLAGLQQSRDNMITFFDIVDELWGIRNIARKTGRLHLNQSWLLTLARLFSDYTEFWQKDDKTLFVPVALKRDIAQLDPTEEEFARLISAGTKVGREMLYQLFVAQLNKRKVNKLIDRYMKKSIHEAAE